VRPAFHRLLPLLAAAGMVALGGPARAQVAAPSLVDEDLPPEEPRPPRPPPPAEPPRAAPTPAPAPEPVQLRALVPVKTTWADVLEAWRERRRAVREQDTPAAQAAGRKILEARRDLAIENLYPFAASEVREAERALRARLPGDAVEHAEWAVQLAPDLADAWLALARARSSREPTQPAAALTPLWSALRAAAQEPHTARAFLGDVLAAAMAALAAAAALTCLVLFLRRARVVLHDFGHLPVVRSATPLQAFFLALVLLLLPMALGLGAWAALATGVAAAWLYLSMRERAVASVALLGLALLPWVASAAAGLTAWTGSLAEEVFELEHGGDDGARAGRLALLPNLPAPALMALGHWHKRRGDLDEAMRWYDRAAAVGGRSPELLVDVGNVKFLRGAAEEAKAAWIDAAERPGVEPTVLAAASYNLSKLFLRQSALEQSQQARRRAQQADEAFIARYAADDDFRANRFLIDVPVSHEAVDALASRDRSAALAFEAMRARLAGTLPPGAWTAGPPLLLLLLWAVLLLSRRLRPSLVCERCGRPSCPRCDTLAGPLCGQCVNVFVRRGVVDSRDRLRKEAQVRRYEELHRWATRLLALLSGGAGHVWRGEVVRGFLILLGLGFLLFVVLFWRGLVPPPHPSPYLLFGKLTVALPLGLVLYGLAVRDAFREGRD
jgi:tetratricopeptide (TPR) repeat protein